jgi:5-methylcytosine-specific restriction enzyme A
MKRARLAMLGALIATLDLRTALPAEAAPKRALPFYSSPEYRAWRTAVIERAAGRCEAPGCGRSERRMFAHHKVAVQDDWSRRLDPTNGQCLCGRCHTLADNVLKAQRLAR